MADSISRTASREPGQGYVPLASQVGGHPGVQTSEDGSLLIKPALPAEVQFYQAVLADPTLAPLRPYVPQFIGTLTLEGEVDEQASRDGAIAVKAQDADALRDVQKDESRFRVMCVGNALG